MQDLTIEAIAVEFASLTDRSLEPRVWRNSAACRDTAPDLFFPIGTTGQAIDHIASARAVCNSCAVQRECLEYALMTNQDAGIWGGATEDERRKIRRERRKMKANDQLNR